MSELFLTVLNMSLMAGYVILFIILIRLPLKKAPKIISYALWGVAAFRLIIPFSFESIFSVMPRFTNAVPIPHDIIYQQSPQVSGGIEAVDSVSKSLPAPAVGASVNPLRIYVEIGAYIWVLGIIALLVYSLVSILVLKRQLKSAKLAKKNIFEAGNLKTPFVLGLIRPKIYLPVGLNVEERNYILLHEQTHIRRKDYIIKMSAFLVLSIHWFNPLVWIAFILMSKDMDLSCDERVLKQMSNEDIKKPYADLLLSLATGKHILNGSPLAFGEGNVKGRIKNVLNYKRPRFWAVLVSAVVLIAAGIVLLSNPAKSDILSTAVTGNENGSDNVQASATSGGLSTVQPEPVPTMPGGLPYVSNVLDVYPQYNDFINAELLPEVYWETDNKTDSPIESETVSIPSGRLVFAFLLTPPYEEKSVFIDEAALKQIISEIAFAKVLPENNLIDWTKADFQDNGLNLYVLTDGYVYNSIELWGPISCNNQVYVDISVMSIMGGKVPNKYGTWRIESQGLGQILADFWKPKFDLQRFHDVTRIDMQILGNKYKKAAIEGDDAKQIAERMLETSKIENGGTCTPDIIICFTFADGTTESGLLNGDGDPGIEFDNGTFIIFDKEIMRELYKLLDYGEGFIPE